MDSILNSIKKLLGITPDYTQFDPDIIMHINAAFLTLREIGVGPATGFSITDASDEWQDFVEDETLLGAARIYVYQKVRLAFDPPTNSALLEALKSSTQEIEWRMNVLVDPATNNGFDAVEGE